MSETDKKSTVMPARYEIEKMENFEMGLNQCYESVTTNHFNKHSSSKCSVTINKEKVLFIVVVVIAVLLLVMVAVISFLYMESLETKKELSELSKSVKGSNNELMQYVNETNKVREDLASLKESQGSNIELIKDVNDSNHGLIDQFDYVYAELNQTVFEVSDLSFELASLKESLLHARIFKSCADVLSSSLPSGYYMVRSSSESVVSVYCNMTLSCGGRTGGWIRVTQLDFSDTNISCPTSLSEHLINNVRACRRAESTSGCSRNIYFTSHKINYSIVCGRVRGYQTGSSDGFENFVNYMRVSTTRLLNSTYLDGISLTHRNLTQHIWSLAATSYSVLNGITRRCSCDVGKPSFVGFHFSCDEESMRNSMEVLWDGEGCRNHDDTWFYRQLPEATTDDIEMRVCRDEDRDNEDILIQSVDIYIQ